MLDQASMPAPPPTSILEVNLMTSRKLDQNNMFGTEFGRGLDPMVEQAISRKLLTSKLKKLSQTLEGYNLWNTEGEYQEMSSAFERKICKECNGHGEVDGEPCPECGGTGIAEPKDDRIHPRGKEIPESPKVLR